ncbi:MAG: glycosyltransferase [Spirochaetaceae bacterium]|nr:glycosyltransferase [Spirochaetaceae bacterium]
MANLKVAIVHYWLVTMRGGEKVVEALCELFPQADIYTHVVNKKNLSPTLLKHNIYTTSISKLPLATKLYQKYLAFMPAALAELDLSSYDLVISSESGPAKSLILPSRLPHLCYCHTPMRYLYDYYHYYLKEAGPLTRFIFKQVAPKLRLWDLAGSNSVSYFIANSANVQNRIARIYRRESEIIYPPVDVSTFIPTNNKKDYYLFFGQLVNYKRVDLAIEAFRQSGKILVIIGGGKKPKNLPPNVKFLGHIAKEQTLTYLAEARALIFPGEEDFGIIPVEAIACGTPVIAYAKGGALETVIEGESGIFFNEQTPSALNAAITKLESGHYNFNAKAMHKLALNFDKTIFKTKITNAVNKLLASY